MSAFFEYPLRLIDGTLGNVEKSIVTLPADQLRREAALLRERLRSPNGERVAGLLSIYQD